jgi:hypothetical protein
MKTEKGFKLSTDQGKANYANAYIGFGVEHRRALTGVYLEPIFR